MQSAVIKLKTMGQMPSDYEDIEDTTLEAYGNLLKEIKTPISLEDAENLILLFPETGLFGLEWTLLHTFETILISDGFDADTYRKLMEKCPSEEWRNTLSKRFDNYLA